jgi:hypothetical protein
VLQLREVHVEFDFIVQCYIPSNGKDAESNPEDTLNQLAASHGMDKMEYMESDSRIFLNRLLNDLSVTFHGRHLA